MNNWRIMWGLLLVLNSASLTAEEATVAVASNFAGAMQRLASIFEKNTQHKIRLAFGSSGKFVAQIQQGAPYAAFFSADQEKPQFLEEQGLAIAGSRFTYAVGSLVLWSSHTNYIEPDIQRLSRGEFNKLALANPSLAPYGAAAEQVLQRLGLLEKTRAKWVLGENIAQTFQFVATGNADLGFIANSQVLQLAQSHRGSMWIVPKELYSPILQDAVILKRAEQNTAIKAFFTFMQSDEARSVIESYGYQTTAREE